jgi:hypothetical protein
MNLRVHLNEPDAETDVPRSRRTCSVRTTDGSKRREDCYISSSRYNESVQSQLLEGFVGEKRATATQLIHHREFLYNSHAKLSLTISCVLDRAKTKVS